MPNVKNLLTRKIINSLTFYTTSFHNAGNVNRNRSTFNNVANGITYVNLTFQITEKFPLIGNSKFQNIFSTKFV